VDQKGDPLTLACSNPQQNCPNPTDYISSVSGSISNDLRDNPKDTKKGSFFNLSAEQALPILNNGGPPSNFTRLATTYSKFISGNFLGNFLNFGPNKQVLAFNGTLGTLLGNFPPYDAFSLGGSNSVRGYSEGALGTGRSFFIGSAELRFPVFDPVGAVAFVDYGTDLNSAAAVLGAPAIVRGKPGSGLGYGLGLRIQSPLGPLRIDFGFNSVNLPSQVNFGLGQKF
jgi:outer membrane protein insertion porin family